jgi:hypothetical protein
MDEGDQKRQLIDGQTEGTGRLRGGVEHARAGVDRARLAFGRARPHLDGARDGVGRVRLAIEDAGWFMREHFVWPVEDSLDRLGRRGAIGVFGGGGIAVAGVIAALVIAGSGGSSPSAGTTEAFITPQRSPTPAPAVVTPAPKPKKKAPKPAGPTLHGAPPDFSPAKDVRSGVGDGTAVGGRQATEAGDGPAKRGSANGAAAGDGSGPTGGASAGTGATGGGKAGGDQAAGATTSSNDTPAATAKIGATPEASASAQAQADALATASSAGVAETGAGDATGANAAGTNGSTGEGAGDELSGPPAPKAAKRVARRFAEAFVVYEVGGIDTQVRKTFSQTSTKQLSRSLLHRPPRQPASVKVPRAKVVNVVAGPSKGDVYTVSVSLLRVGVTSELRLEMEQGVGKKWQVTNVLG